MVEGVVKCQTIGLGGGQQSAIAADESDGQLVGRQSLAVAQGDGQLQGIT